MKRIREELPILSDEYDEGNTANDAERGDSDLELGFRFLEEIEEEAERERFASLDDSSWDIPLGSLDILDPSTCSPEEMNTSAPRVRHQSFEEGIAQAPPTAFSVPTTPKYTRLVPLQQQPSDPGPLPVTPKPARQVVINTDKSSSDNDFNGIKKRKRGVGSGNLDCSVMNVDAQKLYCTSSKDVQSISSTPPAFGKNLPHQAANGLLTPSSLNHPSPLKANASPPGDHWYPNMSKSSGKPYKFFEIATPKDTEKIFSDCTGSPTLEFMQNQNLLAETILSDELGVPVQSFSLPISSRIGLLYDVSSSHDDNGLEKIRRGTKKTKLDQQVSPLVDKPNQYISCNHSSASIEGRAGLHNSVYAAGLASETLPQTGCVRFGVLGTSQFSPILIDLTEPEEDDRRLSVGKTFRSPCNPVPKKVPELEDSSDANPMWVKPGCNKAIPTFEQDSSHPQHETGTGGVTDHQTPISGSTPASNGVLAGSFSMACALQNYMCLRKENNSKPERTLSHYFPVIKPLMVDDRSKDDKTEISRPAKNVESHIAIPSMARPQYIIPTDHRYFVVSTCFLGNRKLARRIQRLYPGAEFIERNFALHGPSASRFQHYPDPASQSIDNDLDEADITISPGIGIILTTSQKIRQCSLPGQAVRFIVRERVARVAPRYERLLILVSKDNIIGYPTIESGNVAPHEVDMDCEAVTDFIGFCSSLTYDTQAMFIAGKEEQLAEWIVAMMAKYSEVELGIKLISEETTWELFLRRAGLNSFAAQAVLGESIGQVTTASVSTAENVGLKAFLRMSVERRVERFEKMFGGSELLKRVSCQLKARW